MNKWFKFYGGEYLADPKMERLSPLERSCWITLLCLASMNGEGKIEFLTVEVLLNKSGIQFDPYHPEEWEKALSVLTKFQNMKMISLSENGDITVLNWEKRQEHNLTVAERVAKSRENRKPVTINVTNVTSDKNRIDKNRDNTIVAEATEEFTFKRGIQKLEESPRRDLNIIALYFERRKPDLQNREQFNAAIRRHLRPAKELSAFSDEQIIKGCEKAEKQTPEWVLETVLKMLTK